METREPVPFTCCGVAASAASFSALAASSCSEGVGMSKNSWRVEVLQAATAARQKRRRNRVRFLLLLPLFPVCLIKCLTLTKLREPIKPSCYFVWQVSHKVPAVGSRRRK